MTARAREVSTGVYVLVVLTAGAYLPSPLFPTYQRAFEFDDLAMTLIYATFALVSAPALLLFGPASDVLGPRSVLRISTVVAAAGSACFALASGPGWLLAGRVAQGIALGAATGAAGALIGRSTFGRSRGAILASTAFLAGTAAGPIGSGVLARFAPAPHVVPYVLHLVLLWCAWRRVSALAEPDGRRSRRWILTRPRVPTGMRLLFMSAALTGFLAWTVVGLFLALVPALLNRMGQADIAVTGCVVGAVLTCSVAAQPLAARLRPRYAQLTGLGILLISLGLLALTAGGSASVTLPAAIAAGIGHGLAYGGAADAVAAAVPENQRGAITGALYLAFYLGSGVPAVAVGLITLWYSLNTATAWVAVVAAAFVPPTAFSVVVADALRRSRKPGRPRSATPR